MLTRDCPLDGLEIKRAPDGDAEPATAFSGYASVFNTTDEFADTVAPGAFAETVAEAKRSGVWPSMLLNHGGFLDAGAVPIGVWTAMSEDDRGLRVEGKLAQTSRGAEVAELLRMRSRPGISGLSIGYFPQESRSGSGGQRVLTKIKLVEISVVTFPANHQARVDQIKAAGDKRVFEHQLRRLGLSAAEARRLLGGGWRALLRDERSERFEELARTVAAGRAELQSILEFRSHAHTRYRHHGPR